MAKKRRKSITCANCQYQFDGIDNYCPNCGQENHSHRAPFKHIIIELIESLTHFDTKFFSTVKALFLKPGLLTKDYIEDKRARYVPVIFFR
jgi:predicted amidophosphoribosyltransferase